MKKIKTPVKIIIAIVSVLAVMFLAVVIVFETGAWKGIYYAFKCAAFRSEARSAEKGRTVFLGDSITDFCDYDRFYPNVKWYNRGISADTTNGILARMNESVYDLSPNKVVLLAGINDLQKKESADDTAKRYELILSGISEKCPNAKIIIQSVYPVRNVQYENLEELCSAGIIELNALLKTLSNKYNCVYLDVYSALSDQDGRLKENLSGDGLHPNDAGYEIISALILPVLEAL